MDLDYTTSQIDTSYHFWGAYRTTHVKQDCIHNKCLDHSIMVAKLKQSVFLELQSAREGANLV